MDARLEDTSGQSYFLRFWIVILRLESQSRKPMSIMLNCHECCGHNEVHGGYMFSIFETLRFLSLLLRC